MGNKCTIGPHSACFPLAKWDMAMVSNFQEVTPDHPASPRTHTADSDQFNALGLTAAIIYSQKNLQLLSLPLVFSSSQDMVFQLGESWNLL